MSVVTQGSWRSAWTERSRGRLMRGKWLCPCGPRLNYGGAVRAQHARNSCSGCKVRWGVAGRGSTGRKECESIVLMHAGLLCCAAGKSGYRLARGGFTILLGRTCWRALAGPSLRRGWLRVASETCALESCNATHAAESQQQQESACRIAACHRKCNTGMSPETRTMLHARATQIYAF